MQIAKVLIVCSQQSKQFREGITPAEALLLRKLHFKESNGSPLEQLEVIGEARTIDVPFKRGEAAYFNQNAGRHIDATPATPEQSHPRTNAEEIARLKHKYTGIIEGKSAFEATFGNGAMLRLPETFKEIEADLGLEGRITYLLPETETEDYVPLPPPAPKPHRSRKQPLVIPTE